MNSLKICFQLQLAPLQLGIDPSLLEDPSKLEHAVETLRAEAEAADREAALAAGAYTRPLLTSTEAFLGGYTCPLFVWS